MFVPQHGSKENAKKIIILLFDGQMTGDIRNLTGVLNMLQMKGIVYYTIRVSAHFTFHSFGDVNRTGTVNMPCYRISLCHINCT